MIVSYATHPTPHASRCWTSQHDYAVSIGREFRLEILGPQPNPYRDQCGIPARIAGDAPDDTPILALDWDVLVSQDAPDVFPLLTAADPARHQLPDAHGVLLMPSYGRATSHGTHCCGVILATLGTLRHLAQAVPVDGVRMFGRQHYEPALNHYLSLPSCPIAVRDFPADLYSESRNPAAFWHQKKRKLI